MKFLPKSSRHTYSPDTWGTRWVMRWRGITVTAVLALSAGLLLGHYVIG